MNASQKKKIDQAKKPKQIDFEPKETRIQTPQEIDRARHAVEQVQYAEHAKQLEKEHAAFVAQHAEHPIHALRSGDAPTDGPVRKKSVPRGI